ncbi:MAG: nitroreductase family protein [Ignavibacteriales bacterium]|nr:nitroreductase family protein [Ignavibacteriales bacterium]
MSKSIIDRIKKRKSVRTFKKVIFEESEKEKVNLLLNQNIKSPFGNISRFVLIEKEFEEKDKGIKLGTYGIIKGAKYFIIGILEKKNKYYNEDFGYAMEKIILDITDLDLGTCWIGGLAKFLQFSKSIKLSENEVIGAISPVGYSAEKMSITEKLLRFSAGSAKRKPSNEIFFHNSIKSPLEKLPDENFNIILEMVRLAPSASNKQPWRIIKENEKNNFHFYLKRNSGYQKMREDIDLQKIDMGIAMCHFELTANELGVKGEWLFKQPENIDIDNELEYIASWISN